MYRRSHYSHRLSLERADLFPRPRSRSAYRRSYVGTGFGYAVRGGYRFNRIYLRSGNSTDLTIIREDWFDVRP